MKKPLFSNAVDPIKSWNEGSRDYANVIFIPCRWWSVKDWKLMWQFRGYLLEELMLLKNPPDPKIITQHEGGFIGSPELKKMSEEYFKCKCPPDLKTGIDGYVHLTPINCLTEEKDIIAERKSRKAEREKKRDSGASSILKSLLLRDRDKDRKEQEKNNG